MTSPPSLWLRESAGSRPSNDVWLNSGVTPHSRTRARLDSSTSDSTTRWSVRIVRSVSTVIEPFAAVPGYPLVFPIFYGALAIFVLVMARHLRVFAAARAEGPNTGGRTGVALWARRTNVYPTPDDAERRKAPLVLKRRVEYFGFELERIARVWFGRGGCGCGRLLPLRRRKSWRQPMRRLLLGRLHLVTVRHLHVRTANDLVEHLLRLLLLDRGLRPIA